MGVPARQIVPCLLALIGVAGCSSDDPISGGACVTNRDCPATEVCIAGQCQGSGAALCTGDDTCPAGSYCDLADGTCKERQTTLCQDDTVCPPSQRCNTATGVCIDGPRACTGEAQCTAIGKHCDLSVQQCRDCVDSNHCAAGLTCVAGSCVDPNEQRPCTGDFTCGAPASICEAGACVPGCTAATNPLVCGAGTVCNTTSGRCVPGQVMCSGDAECGAPDRICESSQCIPGCAEPGGLQCTGGNVCDAATGRCVPPAACANDGQCGAPARVCENSACVPGCGQPGGLACGAGTACDTNTGRCVQLQGPCMDDTTCGPPSSICEGGQCIPGCAQPGGLQCNGNTVCNATSGRCDPGMAVCTNDAACGAPANICNLGTGQCVAGCGQTGCTGADVCNTATGHCEPPNVGAQLDAPCTANADCGSKVCFDLENVGQRCVQSCGASTDCPVGFTCFDYDGAKMCLSASLFTGATFTQPAGASCGGAVDCRSGYCPGNSCVEVCSESSNCGGGTCAWGEVAEDFYLAACDGPVGPGAAGATCSDDNGCQSGVCFQNRCLPLCGSTADCGNGTTCAPLNYSICRTSIFGACVNWAPNIVEACVPGTHGAGAVGAPCTDYNVCRSGLCHTGISQCTDTCTVNADCPATHRCKVVELGQLSDDTVVYVNVCMPEAF